MDLVKGDLVIVPANAQAYQGKMAEIIRITQKKKGLHIAARVVDRTGAPIKGGMAIVTWEDAQ